MTAQFSRDAGRVLGSAYFTQPPGGLTDAEYLRFTRGKDKERAELEDALKTAEDYDSLPKPAKAIFDQAAEVLEAEIAEQEVIERLHGG